jgi:hypothetical protein
METSSGAIRKMGPYFLCMAVIWVCNVPLSAARSLHRGEVVARKGPGMSLYGLRQRRYTSRAKKQHSR